MNGNKFEIEWRQGTASHRTWTADEESAKLIMVALQMHPSVESVRVVSLIGEWDKTAPTTVAG